MNRRNFLKSMGIGLAVAAAPKFIFDLGANLHKAPSLLIPKYIMDDNGIMHLYVGDTIPNGYLVCDGRSINKNDYPQLYEMLKYSYGGMGDKFNVPDLSAKFTL